MHVMSPLQMLLLLAIAHLCHGMFSDPEKDFELYNESAKPNRRRTDGEHLVLELLYQYDYGIRPGITFADRTFVTIGVSLIDIVEVSVESQAIVSNLRLDIVWQDERLRWRPTEYNDQKGLSIRTSRLWIPDIIILNTVSEDFDLMHFDKLAHVRSTGRVELSPYITLASSCQLDLSMFPFDEQTCKIIFSTLSYTTDEIMLVNLSTMVDLKMYHPNDIWDIMVADLKQGTRVIKLRSLQPPYDLEQFPVIEVEIQLRRRLLASHFVTVFVPTWLIVLLLLSCFWVPPRSRKKITLSMTLLMAFQLFNSLAQDGLDKSATTLPIKCLYLSIIMLAGAMTTTSGVFTLWIYYAATTSLGQMPTWLRQLFLGKIAKTLGVETTGQIRPSISAQLDSYQMDTLTKKESFQRIHCHKTSEAEVATVRQTGEQNRIVILQQIGNTLNYVRLKIETEEVCNERIKEWHSLVAVLDRLSFAFLCLIAVSSTVMIFLWYPIMIHFSHKHTVAQDISQF